MAKLKTGSELPTDCTAVDNLPIQQLTADPTLAATTGSGVTARGKLLLASRKDDVIDAFAAEGITICDDDGHSFATANAPLSMYLSAPGGEIQFYYCGRDFEEIDTEDQVFRRYWKGIIEAAIRFALTDTRRHIAILASDSSTGHSVALVQELCELASNKPSDMQVEVYAYNDVVDGNNGLDRFFLGYGPGVANYDTTAVVIIPPILTARDDTRDEAYAIALSATWSFPIDDTNRCLMRVVRAGAALLVWSQVLNNDNLLTGLTSGIWNFDDIYVTPLVTPATTDLVDYFPPSTLEFMGRATAGSTSAYQMTAYGEELLPGLANYIAGDDTSHSQMNLLDEATLTSWGLQTIATQGSDVIDFGGILTEQYFTDMSDRCGVEI